MKAGKLVNRIAAGAIRIQPDQIGFVVNQRLYAQTGIVAIYHPVVDYFGIKTFLNLIWRKFAEAQNLGLLFLHVNGNVFGKIFLVFNATAGRVGQCPAEQQGNQRGFQLLIAFVVYFARVIYDFGIVQNLIDAIAVQVL